MGPEKWHWSIPARNRRDKDGARVEGRGKSVEGRVAGFAVNFAATAHLLTAMRWKISQLAE